MPGGTYIRQARIAGTAANRRVDGPRHGSEDLELQAETGEMEKLGEYGSWGSQPQDTAQQSGAAADADQHGKPARIAEARPGQVDDDLPLRYGPLALQPVPAGRTSAADCGMVFK